MPTGYTSKLHDGNEIAFNEFMLTCARAFGATIAMRDDPMNKPIPERFESSTWYSTKLGQTRRELAEVKTWSVAEAATAAAIAYENEIEYWNRSRVEKEQRRHRYEDMLNQVRAWEPPTPDHQGLKDFCIEQLTTGIKYDCDTSRLAHPLHQDGAEWRANRLASLTRDIDYYIKEGREESERTEIRNRWISALRESLKEKGEK
jgi:hypothetical protein